MAKKKDIKKPLTKGVAKVPVVMQMEALECGAACLSMIFAYYDLWVPLEQMRVDCDVSRDGANARNMVEAARAYGFEAKGYRYEIEDLRKNGKFPCIIHWNFSHFVVLCGFRGNKAILNDPAKGTYSVSMDVFDKSFTGICLFFEPNEKFVPAGKRKSVLSFAFSRLKGARSAFIFIVLTTLIASLIGIIMPAFSRIFIDRLLTQESPSWFYPFMIALASISALQILIQLLETYYKNRINGKMATVGNSTFLWKVLHLPMEFFSQRYAGDIVGRQGSNAGIANSVVETLAPLLLNAMTAVFYLFVMIRYSWILTLVGLSSVVLNMFCARYISKRRINITRVQMKESGKFSAATVAGIEMIETIKASGAEKGFFERWAGYQAASNNQKVKYSKMNAYLGLVPSIISTLTSTAVLMLGVWFTMEGKFTVGMIMAFQGYLSSFIFPIMTLISSGQSLQEMRSEMERIDDVMLYRNDKCYDAKPSDSDLHKLEGNIELKDVTFGYSKTGKPIVKDLNISIKKGERIALVGSSGCGKSTISKLISGLYQPWSGTITFDDKDMLDIDRDVFTSSVAIVDQDITIFEDSISDNLKMWDSSIDDLTMINASKDAKIYDDIMERDGGFAHKLLENGKDLSGGQRQRLEIARALSQDPSILILDEATSALDSKTEDEVIDNIKKRGITCVIVAHRLSTIRDCNEIIVLDKGIAVERGKHDELYAKGGIYTELISNN